MSTNIDPTSSEDSIDQLMSRFRKENQELFKQVERTRERENQLASNNQFALASQFKNDLNQAIQSNIKDAKESVNINEDQSNKKKFIPPVLNISDASNDSEYQQDELVPMIQTDEYIENVGKKESSSNIKSNDSSPKVSHSSHLQKRRTQEILKNSSNRSSPLLRSTSSGTIEENGDKSKIKSMHAVSEARKNHNNSIGSNINRLSEFSNSSSKLVNQTGKSFSPEFFSEGSETPTQDYLSPIMDYNDSSIEFNDIPSMDEASAMKRIKVSIRMRPPHPNESISKHIRISPLTNIIQIKNKQYRFDGVFGPSTQQETVYALMASDLIRDVARGINATLLAYGQTGAGKTYTTLGILKVGKDDGSSSQMNKTPIRSSNSKSMLDGIVPRAIKDLFSRLNEERDEWPTHKVYVSYMQIYMEVIYDLLSSSARSKRQLFLSSTSSLQSLITTPTHSTASTPTNSATMTLGTGLPIREEKGKVYVEGLSKHRVRSFEDVMKLLDYGERARMTAQTKLNQESSRSHTLFQIHVERRHKDSTKVLRSTFTCCDLAGSERQTISHEPSTANQGPEGQNKNRLFEEAKFINLSLSALGNVIHTLQMNKKNSFIPWRDSKLTRVLQPTLSGNSKVHLIVNIGPDDSYLQESLTSIAFGHRAMHVSLRPQINEEVDFKFLALSLQKQLDEVQSLKNQEIIDLVDRNQQMEEELENLHAEFSKIQLNLQDTIAEKEKYSMWYQKATNKNLTLVKLVKKRKDRIAHLDKFVNQLMINSDGEVMWGDQFDSNSGGEMLSPTRIASLDKDIQDFITVERKQILEELQNAKEKNKLLSNKLTIEEKNSTSLNETIAYLTVELENSGKIIDSQKKTLKNLKHSYAYLVKDLKQLDIILKCLQSKEIIPDLKDVSKSNFLKLFPEKRRDESFEDSLLFFDNEIFSILPVEAALSSLLEQISDREKTIEILVQQTRVFYAEELARKNLEELDTQLSQFETTVQAPVTPVKVTTQSLQNSIRKAASLRNSPQAQFPNTLKKFQRWNSILDAVIEAKEKLPSSSFFSRYDFSSQSKANHFVSINQESNELSKRSILDPFTQIILNIERKYSDVKDKLDELKDGIRDRELRIEEVEAFNNELAQKNQILSKQNRLDQEEKIQLQHQVTKLRSTVEELEKLGDLSKQNFELNLINRDLEKTNSKLEEQLQSVQEKLFNNDTTYPRRSLSPDRRRLSFTKHPAISNSFESNSNQLNVDEASLGNTPNSEKIIKPKRESLDRFSKSLSHTDSATFLKNNNRTPNPSSIGDLSKTYAPLLSKPNQQASMRNLKKQNSPTKLKLSKKTSQKDYDSEDNSSRGENPLRKKPISNSGIGNISSESINKKYESDNDFEGNGSPWSSFDEDPDIENSELEIFSEDELDSNKPIVLKQYPEERDLVYSK